MGQLWGGNEASTLLSRMLTKLKVGYNNPESVAPTTDASRVYRREPRGAERRSASAAATRFFFRHRVHFGCLPDPLRERGRDNGSVAVANPNPNPNLNQTL